MAIIDAIPEIDNTELLIPKKEPWHIVEPRIREVFNLKPEDIVIGHGQEYYPKLYNQYIYRQDIQGMRWRTRPDIHVITKHDEFFVEEKMRYKSVEAIQLLLNQQSMINTIYLFYGAGPGGSPLPVESKDINWDNIIVYNNHKKQYDNYLYPYIHNSLPAIKSEYRDSILPSRIGSGDPFIYFDITKHF